MKNKIAIAFLFAYLFSATELNELLKIPFLISHYVEHVQQCNRVSFIDFLLEHYTKDISNDKEHSQLPFKNHVDLCLFTSLKTIPHCAGLLVSPVLTYVDNKLSLPQAFEYSLLLNKRKWQPPRV